MTGYQTSRAWCPPLWQISRSPTAENIRELIGYLRQLPMFGSVTDDDAEKLAMRLEERVSIIQPLGSILIERDHTPWLDAARARIDPYYWNRYRQHLDSGGPPHRLDHHIG